MHVERLTVPVGLPFNQSDLEDHLRVIGQGDLEQAYEVARLANAAARELEHYAQLALLTQTIRVTLAQWPWSDTFRLPIGPVLIGATVTVTDEGTAFPGVTLLAGLRPALRLAADRPGGQVVVEYEAGFGADVAALPSDLRLAILDQAAAFYDARGLLDQRGAAQSQMTGLSPHAARVVARYRRVAL